MLLDISMYLSAAVSVHAWVVQIGIMIRIDSLKESVLLYAIQIERFSLACILYSSSVLRKIGVCSTCFPANSIALDQYFFAFSIIGLLFSVSVFVFSIRDCQFIISRWLVVFRVFPVIVEDFF